MLQKVDYSVDKDIYEFVFKTVFHDKKVSKSNKASQKAVKKELEELKKELEQHLSFFPRFPSVNLITALSRESYERKDCRASLVFLPFQNMVDPTSVAFTYSNENILFEEEKLRLIRKLAESLDRNHSLVLGYDESDNGYYVKCIVDTSKINALFNDYYLFDISGYLKWSARCRNFNLFDYDAGTFLNYQHHSIDLKRQINKAIYNFKKEFSAITSTKLRNVLKIIAELNHGTSFVLFESKDAAKKQADRLCNANRGFAPKNILTYDELCKCIPQFTKIDGGLILDTEFNCYAYGCIYDGKVDDAFSGNLARGSRFNSTWLYVHGLNTEGCRCIGVVLSDDGGIECVKMKK